MRLRCVFIFVSRQFRIDAVVVEHKIQWLVYLCLLSFLLFFLNVTWLEAQKNRKMVALYAGESPSRVTFKGRKVMKKNSSVVLSILHK